MGRYTRKRKSGEIKSAGDKQDGPAARKARLEAKAEKERQAKLDREASKDDSKKKDAKKDKETKDEEGTAGSRWDEEDSDPDEPCPDKIRNGGACTYSRQ